MRQTARRAYWALHRHWDLRAERMLRALDATQQRALMEARGAYVPTRFPLPPVYPLATLLAATPAATLPRCATLCR